MKQEIQIENLKCGGCAATIIKELSALKGVENVLVDVEKSLVTFSSDLEKLEEIKEKLSKLGYPEAGDTNTILHKAKSYVSCAIGRVNS